MASDGEGGLFKGLFRRGSRPVELTGYHAGDVVEGRTVRLVPGASAAGDIRAPEVIVEGLLYGCILAETVLVAAGGQVVGDVCATSVTIEEGGRISGWVHTPTADECALIQDGSLADVEAFTESTRQRAADLLPADLRDRALADSNHPEWVALLRMFQAELGTALLARDELAQAFERRVEEVAGDIRARLHQVEEDFERAKVELEESETDRSELAAKVAERDRDLEVQRRELDGVRALLQQRVATLRDVEQELSELRARAALLEESNESLQQELGAALEPMEQLTGRIKSLEGALQASVQRNAEQEQAQLRWQELAEVSQQRSEELAAQLEPAQRRLEELRQLSEDLSEKLAWAEQQRDEARKELDRLRMEGATRAISDGEQQAMAVAQARSERLEAQLQAARTEIAQLEEQLAWYRLSAEAATARLNAHAGAGVESHATLQEQLAKATEQIRTQRESAENWKARVGRLTELLYQAEQGAKQRAEELEALRAKMATSWPAGDEDGALQQLRALRAENDVLENEVTRLHREIAGQRERLAEAQAALAEVRLSLQEQMAAVRSELANLRGAAARRIRELQAELAAKDAQLDTFRERAERRRRA